MTEKKQPNRRKKVIVVIDTPHKGRPNNLYEVLVNAASHGAFKTEQEALEYVFELLRGDVQLARLYVS
jgi:hypothetical protein